MPSRATDGELERLGTDYRAGLQRALWPGTDQIGFVTDDALGVLREWAKRGFRPWTVDIVTGTRPHYRGEEVAHSIMLCFFERDGFQIEIMQPLEGAGYQFEKLRQLQSQRTGLSGLPRTILSHVSAHVPDLDEATKWWAAKGVQVLADDNIGSHRYAYLDTEHMMGVTLKLIQRVRSGA